MEPTDLKSRLSELTRQIEASDVGAQTTPAARDALAARLDAVAAETGRDSLPSLQSSKDPDLRDTGSRLYRQMAMINSWLPGREERTREWIDLAAELATSDVLRDIVTGEQNEIRDREAFAGIRALCQQGLVDKARRELLARRKATKDPVMRKRIDEFLKSPAGLIGPLGMTPSMFTMNGVGTMLYGERNRTADGTHITTLCLVVLFIPILPIRAYVVRREGTGWRFFGRAPLSPFAAWYRRLIVLVPLLAAFYFWATDAYNSSPTVKETRWLSVASACLEKGDYPGTVNTLANMASTLDESRRARMDGMVRKATVSALTQVQDPQHAQAFLGIVGNRAAQFHKPLGAEVDAAAAAVLSKIAPQPASGSACRDLIAWMGRISPEIAAHSLELMVKTCDACDDPLFLAATAAAHSAANTVCPDAILSRLSRHLLAHRHATWNADAILYLQAADPTQGRAVLLARCESAWKGVDAGNELLAIKSLPPRLRQLLEADGERNLELRSDVLEKLAEPLSLQEPERTWHRLGAARRLAKLYQSLNETDPIRYPVPKVRAWAILAAELDPDNLESRLTAMRYLIADGEFDRAVALGKASQNDPRVALLVGIALARSGKYEEAGTILRPLVERDLKPYTTALLEWEKVVKDKTDASWRSLSTGTAGNAILQRLNSLPHDKATMEAEHWVNARVHQDSYVIQLAKKWKDLGNVHEAASELAMIELFLGQGMPPGAARQERLIKAEQIFLELRKTQKDDPHQELQLGQVYFWLGKETEALEIYDRLEGVGDAKVLHQMGENYRYLSRYHAARRVLEKAFDKASGNEKFEIAMTRSTAFSSSEDRLAWLKKADPKNRRVQMDIAQTEAENDLEAGNYDEATSALRRVAQYYADQPESAVSLNNGAVVQNKLARATGDPKYMLEALNLMRRSHEKEPEDAIVLSNYVNDLEVVAASALAGTALRRELLHEMPSYTWMEYVVPLPTLDDWAVRAKAQPEMRKAAELGVKSAILSPESTVGIHAQASYLLHCQDTAGLRKLREAAENRPATTGDQAPDGKKDDGELTESVRKQFESSIARWDALLPAIRKAGHAPTLGFALIEKGNLQWGTSKTKDGYDLKPSLKTYEEAVEAFNAFPTIKTLAAARLVDAARSYASTDKEFDRWIRDYPGTSSSVLLPFYALAHPDRVAAIRDQVDVRKAVAAVAETQSKANGRVWTRGWAWLEMAAHPAREAARQTIKTSASALEHNLLDFALEPNSLPNALDAWMAATACEEKAVVDRIARRAREKKLLPDFFKE